MLLPDNGLDRLLPLRGVRGSGGAGPGDGRGFDDRVLFLDLKRESDRLLAAYLQEALTLSLAGSLVIVLLLASACGRRAASPPSAATGAPR